MSDNDPWSLRPPGLASAGREEGEGEDILGMNKSARNTGAGHRHRHNKHNQLAGALSEASADGAAGGGGAGHGNVDLNRGSNYAASASSPAADFRDYSRDIGVKGEFQDALKESSAFNSSALYDRLLRGGRPRSDFPVSAPRRVIGDGDDDFFGLPGSNGTVSDDASGLFSGMVKNPMRQNSQFPLSNNTYSISDLDLGSAKSDPDIDSTIPVHYTEYDIMNLGGGGGDGRGGGGGGGVVGGYSPGTQDLYDIHANNDADTFYRDVYDDENDAEYQVNHILPINADEGSKTPHFDAEFFPESAGDSEDNLSFNNTLLNPSSGGVFTNPKNDAASYSFSFPSWSASPPTGAGTSDVFSNSQPQPVPNFDLDHLHNLTLRGGSEFNITPLVDPEYTNVLFDQGTRLAPDYDYSIVAHAAANNSSIFGGNITDLLMADGGREDEYTWSILMMAPLVVFGVAGNTLVILAISLEKRLQNVTNYFLLSLAVTDLLVSLIVMPFSIINVFTGRWLFGLLLCDFFVTSDVLMCTSSILHLCTISLERYIGIRYPLWTKNKSKRVVLLKIVLVWTIALAITSPITVLGVVRAQNVLVDDVCVVNNEHFVIYGSIFAFFLPLAIMILMYALTVRMLNKQARLCQTRRADDGEGEPMIRRSTSRRNWQGRRKFYGREVLSATPSCCDPRSGGGGGGGDSGGGSGGVLSFHQRYRPLGGGVSRHNTIPLYHNSHHHHHHHNHNHHNHQQQHHHRNHNSSYAHHNNYLPLDRHHQIERRETANCCGVGGVDWGGGGEPKRLRELVRKHHVAVKAANILLLKRDGQQQQQQQQQHHQQRGQGGVQGPGSSGHHGGHHRGSTSSSTNYSVRRDNSVRTEQKASKVLGVVFMIFVVCWAPFFTVNILTVLCTSCRFEPTLITAFVWLGYVSSTLNPIIYTIFNNIFRITFIKLLCCRYRLLHRARSSSHMTGLRNGILACNAFCPAPLAVQTSNSNVTNSTLHDESHC
ncbi:5-HT2 receptor [Aplysia californica]|uniref:5-HT2 receptor n=1 Tax=Aplysia californica TaxID=6500 RepID=F2W7D9_APLCA|nr:5-HT2 receptor [Aplysia californica]AEA76356.1 5-HT2 receptor [Aplysia californica]